MYNVCWTAVQMGVGSIITVLHRYLWESGNPSNTDKQLPLLPLGFIQPPDNPHRISVSILLSCNRELMTSAKCYYLLQNLRCAMNWIIKCINFTSNYNRKLGYRITTYLFSVTIESQKIELKICILNVNKVLLLFDFVQLAHTIFMITETVLG
jgi:hypothetical protein